MAVLLPLGLAIMVAVGYAWLTSRLLFHFLATGKAQDERSADLAVIPIPAGSRTAGRARIERAHR